MTRKSVMKATGKFPKPKLEATRRTKKMDIVPPSMRNAEFRRTKKI